MSRRVPEWVGKDDDQQAPQRVRVRVWLAKGGKCHRCERRINAERGEGWTLEHVVALVNGGENRESNLDLTCDWCLPAKNAEDVAEKSRTYRKRSKHVGAKKRTGFRGWRKMNGDLVWRDA